MNHSATKPSLNYPWLLAVCAVGALLISKSFDGSEPIGTPEIVGPPSEPTLAEGFLLRAKVGDVEIGNAFASSTDKDSPTLVLTAMHRFGPAGGLSQAPSPASIAALSDTISFSTNIGKDLSGVSVQPVGINLAGPLGSTSAAGDIASFSATGSGLSPAELSPYFPDVGSFLWLAFPGEDDRPRKLKCEIFATDPTEGLFYFRFPADSLTLAQANANTGAPIIDLGGKVLGIHVGAAVDSDSAPPYGLALSTTKFLPHLLQALNGPAAPKAEEKAMAATKSADPE